MTAHPVYWLPRHAPKEIKSMPLSRIVSRFGAAIALVFLLSIVDSVVSGHLESDTFFRALAGMQQPISGNLAQPVADLEALTYVIDTPLVQLDLIGVKGRIWHGKLVVAPSAPQGTFHLRVFAAGSPADSHAPVLTVRVYDNPGQYQASFKSLIRRFSGLSPLWLALAAMPLVLGSLWLAYYLSGRREAVLADKGIVPIVKMVRLATDWEITFALGLNQGIALGDTLLLLDENLQPAGQVVVARIEASKSQALVDFTANIAPSFFIAKHLPGK
jgi:hypothetical protein